LLDMSSTTWLVLLVATVVSLIYQLYITRRVHEYPSFTHRQKVLQIALIWLLPLIGAAVVHAFFKQDASPPRPRDTAFTPEVGHDGGSDVGH
jgi:hypothetical protein